MYDRTWCSTIGYVTVGSEDQVSQRAGGCEPGGFGRDLGGRVESWRGEGGEATDAGAVVKACPQKNEGGRMGRRKERSAAGPIRDRRAGGREPGSFGRDFGVGWRVGREKGVMRRMLEQNFALFHRRVRGGGGGRWGSSAAGVESRKAYKRDLAAARTGRDCGGRVKSWRGEGGDAADAGAVAGSCPHKSVREGGGVGGWEVAQREPIRGLTLCLGSLAPEGISFRNSVYGTK